MSSLVMGHILFHGSRSAGIVKNLFAPGGFFVFQVINDRPIKNCWSEGYCTYCNARFDSFQQLTRQPSETTIPQLPDRIDYEDEKAVAPFDPLASDLFGECRRDGGDLPDCSTK